MNLTVDIERPGMPLSELVSKARTGTDVVLAEGDKPVARLIPLPSPSDIRIPGLNRGALTPAEDFDAPLPDSFWAGER